MAVSISVRDIPDSTGLFKRAIVSNLAFSAKSSCRSSSNCLIRLCTSSVSNSFRS